MARSPRRHRPVPASGAWPAFQERANVGEITGEAAHKQYRAQPAVAAAMATGVGGLYGEIDEYLVSENEYAQPAEAAAGVTDAVVKYRKWYRGCWWDADPAERDSWNRRFHELLADVPDDTLLTVMDCHGYVDAACLRLTRTTAN